MKIKINKWDPNATQKLFAQQGNGKQNKRESTEWKKNADDASKD